MQAAGRPQRRGWGVGDDRGRRGPGAALHGLGPDCASGSRSLKSNQGALYRSPAGQSTVPEPHGGMACRKWDGTEAHRVLVGEQRSGVYVSLAARTSARCSEDYVADGVRLRRLLQILPGACRSNRPSTTTPIPVDDRIARFRRVPRPCTCADGRRRWHGRADRRVVLPTAAEGRVSHSTTRRSSAAALPAGWYSPTVRPRALASPQAVRWPRVCGQTRRPRPWMARRAWSARCPRGGLATSTATAKCTGRPQLFCRRASPALYPHSGLDKSASAV